VLGRPLHDQEPLGLPVDAEFFAQLSPAGRGRGFADIDVAAGDVSLITVSLAYQQQPVVADGIGIPRDGGMADLLAEAGGPAPAFAAVVCEDINRSARDTFNALKLGKNSPPAASPVRHQRARLPRRRQRHYHLAAPDETKASPSSSGCRSKRTAGKA
jgi:hypothetical protein